ncbi:MAG: glycosyltransferase, partial [Candidatus Levyibacteriota bacterium]
FVHFQRPLEHVKPSVFTRLKIKRVSSFFCNSAFTKHFIDKTFGIYSQILYPPVELFPKKIPKQNIILHVGRFRVVERTVGMRDFKKQYLMLDVFKEMVDEGLTGWKFVMAVSVQDKDRDAFAELKNGAKGYPVEFEVNKTNSQLWEFYAKAKIYWHASGYGEDLEKNPEYAEHFGISTVEAMGAGAVPVVINAGGQKEIVTDGKNGLLWDSLEELKKRTLELIGSEAQLEKLSQQAKKRAEDFSKEAFEKKIKGLIS